ncbi:glycosyltransferase [Facklamia sp. 7083-14-GEN3]|uniref:glycosyltransferase n=1 Tax=Facklamia sp. 7083-14-GEN3 TaxID=2973478 RepID=UPI00215C71CC|nr:glycosyltransferase [Facklamia sp. 7083-14-GEN3]MCR8968937.1 glycosyltransferase [Facklamia sp. 7083-14-GEN3]
MKKILHYVGAMNRGGMENYLMTIYRKIDKNNFQFHFAVHQESPGDYDNEIKKMGGKIFSFPSFRKNPIKYFESWDNFWRNNKNEYSWFHYHTNSLANISAIKAAHKNGFNSIIIHGHSSYADKGKFQLIHDLIHHKNQTYIKKYIKHRVAVSQLSAEWLYGTTENISILRNGVDYTSFYFNNSLRDHLRKKFKIPNDSIVIGHVGNFLKVKNHIYLLEIFKHILEKRPNSKLFLIGQGPLKKDIHNYLNSNEISDSVFLLGSIPNVSDYLNIFDLFVFPSFYEGLPISLIEAQVNGLNVFMSNTISDEVIISDRCKQISIDNSSKIQASKLLEIGLPEIFSRTNNINNKYNIQNTINDILKIYYS